MMRRAIAWMLCVVMLVTSVPVSAEELLPQGGSNVMPLKLTGDVLDEGSADGGEGATPPTTGSGIVVPAIPTATPGVEGTAAPTMGPGIVVPEIPTAAPGAEETAAPTATPGVEETEAPEGTPSVEETEAPEGTPDPEETEAPEGTPDVEETEAPEGTPDPEETEAPEETPEPAPLEAALTAGLRQAFVGEPVELSLNVAGGEGEMTAVYQIAVNGEMKETSEPVSVSEGWNSYVFVPEVEGDYTITAIVTDETGHSAQASVDLSVAEKQTEVLEAALTTAARSGFAGDTAKLTLNVAGGEGDLTADYQVAVNGEIQQTAESVSVVAGDNDYSFVPASGGDYTITAVVSDALGQSAQASVSLPVAVHDTTSYDEMLAKAQAARRSDWGESIASVAESQLGYHESVTDFIIDENGVRRGYTVYGHRYGSPYLEWSALFVGYVMMYADATGVLPYSSRAAVIRQEAIKKGAYMQDGYVPMRGDIVFFNRGEDESTMGIVTGVEGTTVTIIEGNSNEAVERNTYSLDSSVIMGYVSINVLQGLPPTYPVAQITYSYVVVEKVLDGNDTDPNQEFEFELRMLNEAGETDTSVNTNRFIGYLTDVYDAPEIWGVPVAGAGKPSAAAFTNGVARFKLKGGEKAVFIFGFEYLERSFEAVELSNSAQGYTTFITGGTFESKYPWFGGTNYERADQGNWRENYNITSIDNRNLTARGSVGEINSKYHNTLHFKFTNCKDKPHKREISIDGKDVIDKGVTGQDGKIEYPSVQIGEEIVYEVEWVNSAFDSENWPIEADVIITDKLDEGVDFVEADNGGQYDSKTHTVTWTLLQRKKREQGKVHVTVKVNSKALVEDENGRTVENTAYVKVGNNDAKQTETVTNPVAVGDLTVSKTVISDEAGDKEKEFKFTVTLDPVYSGTFGDMTFDENGKAEFTLKDGESKTARDLPVGTKYTVVESDNEGFAVYYTDDKGTIRANAQGSTDGKSGSNNKGGSNNGGESETSEHATAKVVNMKQEKPVKEETDPGAGELVSEGQVITYQIKWKNTQRDKEGKPATATVVITDPLDEGVDFVSADNDGVYDAATHTVTWTLGEQEAGAEGVVELKVVVNSKAASNGKVENQAGVQVGNHPKVDTDIVENPTWKPEKTEVTPGADELVKPGDEITYEITWKNYQDDVATVTITDALDKNVAFVSADNDGAYDEATRTVTWALGEKAAGEEGTVTLTVRVLDGATEAGGVENQAGVKVGNDAEIETNIIENPTWKPEKTETQIDGEDVSADDPDGDPALYPLVKVGQTITYAITWKNYKTEAATITITDKLDPGVDFAEASDGGMYDAATRTVTWTLGEKAAGAEGFVTLTVTVNEKATSAGKVDNQARVQVGNDTARDTQIVENPTPTVEKEEVTPGEGEFVVPGQEITYTISWNNYNADAATVTITDALDPNVAFVSADNGGAYDAAKHTVTWVLENRAPGAQGVVTLVVQVQGGATAAGGVTNQAGVTVGNDPEIKTNIIENPTWKPEKTETQIDGVDVSPVNPDSDPVLYPLVQVGQTITYAITWKNYKTEAATVTITDKLDPSVDFTGASDGGVYDAATHTVTWTLPDRAAGTDGTVTLTVTVNENAKRVGRVDNQARVQVDNDPAQDTKIVENPTPEAKKDPKEVERGGKNESLNDGDLVYPGDIITYVITFNNYTDQTATVTITDTLDPNLEPLFSPQGDIGPSIERGTIIGSVGAGTAAYDPNTRQITLIFQDVTPGTEAEILLKVKVLKGAANAGEVTNQAGVQVGNEARVDTDIVKNPTWMPHKTETQINGGNVSPVDATRDPILYEKVQVGDLITYTISWENYKAARATIVITDVLDPNVAFDSADNGGTYNAATHTVTWTLMRQNPGAKGKVTLTVRVLESALEPGAVLNTASVKVGSDDWKQTETVENPLWKPEKTEKDPGEGELVLPDDVITYEITWRNYKAEAATVIITDKLDPGVDFVSANNAGAYDAATHTVTWTLQNQAAGAEGKVTLKVKVNEDAKYDWNYSDGKTLDKDTLDMEVFNQASVKVGDDPEVKTKVIENPTWAPTKKEKTPGAGQMVLVGDEITYTISWKNYLEEAATVVITDALDAGVDFVSATAPGVYDAATHTVTWTLADKAAGAEGTVTLKVKVNEKATPAENVENQAGVKVGNKPEVKTEIVENPTWTPEKEEVTPGEGKTVVVDDEITYTISWKNYKTETATVIITDKLDPGVDFVSAEDGGEYDAATHTVTWTLGEQAAGAEGKVTLTVKVNEDAKYDWDYSDGKTLDESTLDMEVLNQAGVKVGNDDEVKTKVIENPTWTPEKEEVTPGADETVVVGDEITYTISWKNYLDAAATVVITDALDKGVDFVSADNGGVYDAATHTVTWTLENREAGAKGVVELVVKVNETATQAGQVENQAGVKVGNKPEVKTEPVENPTWTPEKEEVTPGADETVVVGEEITYTISWKNYKAEAATVIITDKLDPGVDFKDADNGGVYDEATHTVTWTLADQEAGAEGKVTLKVTVNEKAKYDWDYSDGKTLDESTLDMKVLNQAGVQVGDDPEVKTEVIENPTWTPEKEEVTPGADKPVFVGDEITYTISWKNYLDAAATVVITDALDAGVDFVSASDGGVYDEETHTVTWTLADKDAEAEGTVTLKVKVNENATPAGKVENQAGVKVGNKPEVKTEIVENPKWKPEKTETDPGEGKLVLPDDEITYTISWKNYKAEAATVIITDKLDPGVDFVSAEDGGAYDAATHTVTWTLGEQAAGAEGVVTLKVKVNANAKYEWDYSDGKTLDESALDMKVLNQAGVKVGNDPEVKTDIIENPTWEPEKTETDPGAGTPVVVGEEITYTISWKNYKTETATVIITDKLDPGVDFVSADNGGKYDAATHTVTWTLADREDGAEGVVTLKVKVNEKAKYDWDYSDGKTLDESTLDMKVLNQAGVRVGDDPEVKTEVIENPVPSPEKTETAPGEDELVLPGDEITYEISWRNYQTETATVTITDVLDAGVDFVDASEPCMYDEETRTVTWTLGEQEAGAEGTVTLTVKVNEKAAPAGKVENQAGVQVGNDPKIDTNVVENPTPNPEKTETAPGEGKLVLPGDEITYEISWKNYKAETATVIITDKLDPGVDFEEADNGGVYDAATHTVTWTLTDQEAGAEGKVTLKVTVNENATPAGKVENQAGVQVGDDPEVKTKVIENPTPNPKKEEVTPGEDELVFVGNTITYTISWRNYQSDTATVTITDALDEYVEFVSADNGGAYDAGTHTVTWNLGEQAAGAEGKVTLTVRVSKEAEDFNKVENQAGVKVGNDPKVDTNVVENPISEPNKTESAINGETVAAVNDYSDPIAFPQVEVGDEITYTITWKNYRKDTATVIITDPLDPNVEFVDADNGGKYDKETHTVTWTLEDREGKTEGTVTLTVRVLESAKTLGEVLNTAYVQVGNDDVQQTETVVNPIPNPKKEEVKPGEGKTVFVGDVIAYEITWRNYRTEKATVTITDKLDPGVDFVSASHNGVYDKDTHTVTWTFADQAARTGGKVTLKVKVNANAKYAWDYSDGKTLDESELDMKVLNQAGVQVGDDSEVKTEVIENPTWEPEKKETDHGEGEMVFVGNEITYTISWKNYQEGVATVTITDALDAGVDFVSASDGGVYDEDSHTVKWTFTDQEAGAEGIVTLKVKVNENATPAGKVENQAGVQVGNDPEVKTEVIENPTPNPKKEEVTPGADELVFVGDEITYEITWKNYHEEAATVTITDALDKGVDFVSADNGGVYDKDTHTVTWTLENQEAGAEGVVELVVVVNEKATPAGKVLNQAGVQVGSDPKVDTEIVENPTPNPKKEEVTPGADELVFVGNEITYTISWKNYKAEAATVTITDALDKGVDFVSATHNGKYDAATHTVTWTLENQEAGAEGVVELVVVVNEKATPAGKVENQAGVQVGDDPEVKTEIIENPTPDPKKSEMMPGAGNTVFVGQEIIYRITWKNYQDKPAKVTITDELDPGVTFERASDGGVYDPTTHTVTWTLGEQAPGAKGSVTLLVIVNPKAMTEGKVENQAGVQVGNDPKVDTEIVENPTPNPKKEEVKPGADELVFVGDEITYTISWQNYHAEAATVTITDKLDPGVTFKDADNGGVYDEATHTVTWTLEDQAAGAEGVVELVVVVNEKATPAGKVQNQAGVQVGDDPEVKTKVIENPTPSPKKEEVKPGADETVFVGDEITYEITWKNYHEEAATVTITDALDKGVDFVSATHNGKYDAATHTVTWTLTDQEAGAEGTVTLKVKVNANATPAGKVENQAIVQVGDDPEVKTEVIENPTPSPKKTETDPGADELVFVGETITYEITWRNYQSETATVIITDKLDDGVDFLIADNNGVYDPTKHTVTWTLKDQAAGAEGKVTLYVQVNANATPAGKVENQAGVKVGNDSEVKTEIIKNPTPNPKKEEKLPGADNLVFVGDQILYQITWRNYHEEAATVTITDALDPGVDFVSASDGGKHDEKTHTVTWTLEDQAAGAEGTVTLVVEVNAKATPVGKVENQAGVQVGDDPEVKTEVIENPTPNPKKEEVKPGADKPVFVGDEITYTISWKNYQKGVATVTITDALDAGVDFVSATHNGKYDAATHTVTWTLANQAAGAEGAVTLVVKVNAKATPAEKVENQAGVKVGSDPKVDTEIVENPTPNPKKTETYPGEGEMVFVGDEITYTISWKNYQKDVATVTITDALDKGVDFVSADNGGKYDAATHTVTWTLAGQAAGAEGVVTLAVKVNAKATPAGKVENQAGVKVGSDPKVDTEIVENPTPNPKKEEVTPGAGETVFVDDMIMYRITWKNYKNDAATVTITDALDAGVDFVSASDSGAYDEATHTVTWTLENQAAGAEGTVTLVVQVNANAEPAGKVENQAGVQVANDPKVDTDIVENPVDEPTPTPPPTAEPTPTPTADPTPTPTPRPGGNGPTPTPTPIPEMTYVTVEGQKTWVDNNNATGLRPTEIRVILLRDGDVIEERTVTEADGWHYSFTDLPEFNPDTGARYVYTIRERMVTGYYSRTEGYDLVNTLLTPNEPDPENPTTPNVPRGFSRERMTEEQLEGMISIFEYGVPLWGGLLGTGRETPAYPFVFAGIGMMALIALLAGSRKRRRSYQ